MSIDPELFDEDTVLQWGEKMKTAFDKDTRTIPTIQAPSAFKKETRWRTWKEQWVTYLGTKTGISKAPLTYVTREAEDPADPEDFDGDHDHDLEVLITPHIGDAYKRDNGAVYDELKTLLINSPAYTWIHSHDHLRNGRGAWLALIEHYIGANEQNCIKDAAYASIQNATYAGERCNWTFEQYYHVHQDAHYDLETYGEHISENKKVTNFLRGISAPQCEVAKAVVLSNSTYMNDFTVATQYIVSTLNVTILNNITSSKRNISGTNRRNDGKKQGRTKKGKKVTRSFTPEEWRKLSKEQKKEILDARAKYKAQRAKEEEKDANNGNNNHQAAAAGTNLNDMQDDDDNCEDIHRVNLPWYACGAKQLPPYHLLRFLEGF